MIGFRSKTSCFCVVCPPLFLCFCNYLITFFNSDTHLIVIKYFCGCLLSISLFLCVSLSRSADPHPNMTVTNGWRYMKYNDSLARRQTLWAVWSPLVETHTHAHFTPRSGVNHSISVMKYLLTAVSKLCRWTSLINFCHSPHTLNKSPWKPCLER